jgi:hypothetical protein
MLLCLETEVCILELSSGSLPYLPPSHRLLLYTCNNYCNLLCLISEVNKTIEKLNLESNNILPQTLAKIFESINVHQKVNMIIFKLKNSQK